MAFGRSPVGRKVIPPTPAIIGWALVDAFGMALFATGAFYLVRDTHLFVRGFPSTSGEAWGALIGGLALMFWAIVKILRARVRQLQAEPPPGEDRPA